MRESFTVGISVCSQISPALITWDNLCSFRCGFYPTGLFGLGALVFDITVVDLFYPAQSDPIDPSQGEDQHEYISVGFKLRFAWIIISQLVQPIERKRTFAGRIGFDFEAAKRIFVL